MGFVGRAEQLRFLHDRFEGIEDGRANVTLVRGIAGSGKSVLVAEFLERIAPDTGAMVAVVSCDQYAEESFSVCKHVVVSLVESGHQSPSEKRPFGPESAGMISSGQRLANLYSAAGRDEQAIGLGAGILEVMERRIGIDHQPALDQRDRLAGHFDAAGRGDEADALRT